MQNGDSEEARNVADRDDEEATSSDSAVVEEAVGERDDEVTTADADCANDDGVAKRDDEDQSSDAEQAAAAAVTGADREDMDGRKSKKGDCIWSMCLPSTSGKEALTFNNNYGCEHYKRKSKFVVSFGMASSSSSSIVYLWNLVLWWFSSINIATNSLENWREQVYRMMKLLSFLLHCYIVTTLVLNYYFIIII